MIDLPNVNDPPQLNPLAGPWIVDPGFGTGGYVRSNAPLRDFGTDVLLADDGKIIVAGTAQGQGPNVNDFAVSRYHSDGTPDVFFGAAGRVVTQVTPLDDFASGAALQPDGKILVTGFTGIQWVLDLVRYNADGTLDSSFGIGGVVQTNVRGEDFGAAVAVQPDGKIVVAGTTGTFSFDEDFLLLRYGANGVLDPSFDGDGIVITSIGTGIDAVNALALQADGKIVVAGLGSVGFALARYTTTGTLDTTFDSDGIALLPLPPSGDWGSINAIALQSDGKIVAAGVREIAYDFDFALARFNTDGTLDSSFGTNGITTLALSGIDIAFDIALQADGSIVVVGQTAPFGSQDRAFGLVRLDAHGRLDSFSADSGYLLLSFGSDDSPSSMALQSDGAIVIAGSSLGDTDYDLALTRVQVGSTLPDRSGIADHALTFALSSRIFVDPEGQPLTYTASNADGSPLPAWLNFDASTLTFSGTPADADAGILRIAITANDGQLTGTSGFDLRIDPTHGAIGSDDQDTLGGSDDDDTLIGLSGDDVLDGGVGNDFLRGGSGEDRLTGGSGTDTALYAGASTQYAMIAYEGSIWLADHMSTRDGLDQLSGVEYACFDGDGIEIHLDRMRMPTALDYIASHDDLIAGFGVDAGLGFSHFTQAGRFEHRSASFDALGYIASYPDLIFGLGADREGAALHYLMVGRPAGRSVAFNGLEYIASYADLMTQLGADRDGGALHYIATGVFEGRAPTFDALDYIASYADLLVGFGADRDLGASHYIASGQLENRSVGFNVAQYLANYADLAAGFGNNHELAAIHYIQHGFYEGRTDQPI